MMCSINISTATITTVNSRVQGWLKGISFCDVVGLQTVWELFRAKIRQHENWRETSGFCVDLRGVNEYFELVFILHN